MKSVQRIWSTSFIPYKKTLQYENNRMKITHIIKYEKKFISSTILNLARQGRFVAKQKENNDSVVKRPEEEDLPSSDIQDMNNNIKSSNNNTALEIGYTKHSLRYKLEGKVNI